MHEQVCCCDEAANHQLPIAVTFSIILTVCMEECSSLMQNLMQICCSTCSVILNVRDMQYICSLNGHPPPPLTSTVKSSLFAHAHSSPLSLAAPLYQCCTYHPHCINSGCTFSRHASHKEKRHKPTMPIFTPLMSNTVARIPKLFNKSLLNT